MHIHERTFESLRKNSVKYIFKLFEMYEVDQGTLKCVCIGHSPSETSTKNTAIFQL